MGYCSAGCCGGICSYKPGKLLSIIRNIWHQQLPGKENKRLTKTRNDWYSIHHTSNSIELDVILISMKLNKEWHLQHRMPKNPTMDERIAWHIEHTKHCTCREMPATIKEEIKKRRIKIPSA